MFRRIMYISTAAILLSDAGLVLFGYHDLGTDFVSAMALILVGAQYLVCAIEDKPL